MQAAVLGKDDRTSLQDKHKKIASGIGIIAQPSRRGWSCTAFCVADNIVATNAHCILKNPTVGKRLNLRRTIFILPTLREQKKQTTYHKRYSYLQYVDPKIPALAVFSGDFKSTRSVKSQSQDWAFAKLTNKACKGRVLEFDTPSLKEISKAASKKKIYMIGFHGDKQMKDHLYSKNCRIRSPNSKRHFLRAQRIRMLKENTLLPHTCDAYKGSSGSPIIMSTKQGPKVVGINLGSLRYEKYQINRNPYTGKVTGRRKLKYRRETNMAIRPKAFLKGLTRFRQETLLNDIKEFKKLQTLLKVLNFYRGKVDGKYGPATRRAIINYERKNNLPSIALPTKELLERLKQEKIRPADKTL